MGGGEHSAQSCHWRAQPIRYCFLVKPHARINAKRGKGDSIPEIHSSVRRRHAVTLGWRGSTNGPTVPRPLGLGEHDAILETVPQSAGTREGE